MKRPSYLDAIAWIAFEDNPADAEDVEALSGYVSVLLVADLFGVEARDVARRVYLARAMDDLTTGRVVSANSRCGCKGHGGHPADHCRRTVDAVINGVGLCGPCARGALEEM